MSDATTRVVQVAPNSCEISTSASGKVQVAVKVYADDEKDAVLRAADAYRMALGLIPPSVK